MLDAFQRALIEKAGKDNGWEHVKNSTPDYVDMSSAFHGATVLIGNDTVPAGYMYSVRFDTVFDQTEVIRSVENIRYTDNGYFVKDEGALSKLLYRCAALIVSLPDTPLQEYEQQVKKELQADTTGISKTEREGVVRQRVGQNIYRDALMNYWQHACALTGITIPAVLKASHAKPWADCSSDAERLNVYNGFLFAANIDSLFDAGLISFTDTGLILISKHVPEAEYLKLGISSSCKLRWIDAKHVPFLQWHREKVFQY